ncbi:MAG: hypothetical protein IKI20_08090, partial [Lachnospiraceae bacterium]|nr:hypothetical protein [Lachnospiraceae bacterium]
ENTDNNDNNNDNNDDKKDEVREELENNQIENQNVNININEIDDRNEDAEKEGEEKDVVEENKDDLEGKEDGQNNEENVEEKQDNPENQQEELNVNNNQEINAVNKEEENLNKEEENLEENQQINPEEEKPEDNIEVEAEAEGPVRMDLNVVKFRANTAVQWLKDATLTARGSIEYKNHREEFIKVQEKWNKLMNDPKKPPTEEQLESLRWDLQNVQGLGYQYLRMKANENDTSRNAEKRVSAVEASFEVSENQLHILDDKLKDLREKETEIDIDKVYNDADRVLDEFQNGQLFMRGSDKYKDAANSFIEVKKQIGKFNERLKNQERELTIADITEMRNVLSNSMDALVGYSSGKIGNASSENTHLRTDATVHAMNVIDVMNRKLDSLQDGIEKSEPKEYSFLASVAKQNISKLNEAEIDVHFGSKEYENAKNEYIALTAKMDVFAEPDYKYNAREAEDFLKQMDLAEKNVDAYLKKKEGKDLSEKTEKRVEAMRRTKQSIYELRRKFKQTEELRRRSFLHSDDWSLRVYEDGAKNDLEFAQNQVKGKTVYFGGKDYDQAFEIYKTTIGHEKERDKAIREGTQPSKEALRAEIEELKTARLATRKYIDRKENELADKRKGNPNAKLDEKGTERLKSMNKAYDTLNVRLDRATDRLEKLIEAEKTNIKDKADKFLEEKKENIKGKEGKDLLIAEIEYDAASVLKSKADKRNLTLKDKVEIRNAISELTLIQGVKDGTLTADFNNRGEFKRRAIRIGGSPEFISLFPPKNLTQEYASKFMANPNSAKNTAINFKKNVSRAIEEGKKTTFHLAPKIGKGMKNEAPKAGPKPK